MHISSLALNVLTSEGIGGSNKGNSSDGSKTSHGENIESELMEARIKSRDYDCSVPFSL